MKEATNGIDFTNIPPITLDDSRAEQVMQSLEGVSALLAECLNLDLGPDGTQQVLFHFIMSRFTDQVATADEYKKMLALLLCTEVMRQAAKKVRETQKEMEVKRKLAEVFGVDLDSIHVKECNSKEEFQKHVAESMSKDDEE